MARVPFYAILLRSSFALGSCITALRLIPDPSHLKHPGTWARVPFYTMLLRSSFALGSCITALRLIPDPSHLKHPGTWARVPFYTILLCFIFCLRFIYRSVEINTRPLSPKVFGHVGTRALTRASFTPYCYVHLLPQGHISQLCLIFPTPISDNLM